MHYAWRSGTGVPGYGRETYANATIALHSGAWSGTCDEQTHEVVEYTDPWTFNNTTGSFAWTSGAIAMPTDVHEGQALNVSYPEAFARGCEVRVDAAVVEGRMIVNALVNGVRTPRDAWYAVEPSDSSPYQDFVVAWDFETGMLLSWNVARMHSSDRGETART